MVFSVVAGLFWLLFTEVNTLLSADYGVFVGLG